MLPKSAGSSDSMTRKTRGLLSGGFPQRFQRGIGGPTRGEWWTTRAGPDHPLDPLGMAKFERNDDSWRKTALCAICAAGRPRPTPYGRSAAFLTEYLP